MEKPVKPDKQKNPAWVVFLMVAFGAILLLYLFRSLLAPMIIAMLIAYAFDPLVNRMQKLKLSRTLAILTLSVVIIVGLVLISLYTGTVVKQEVLVFWERLPQYAQTYEDKLRPWIIKNFAWEIPKDFQGLLSQAQEKLKDPNLMRPLSAFLAQSLSSFITFFVSLLSLLIIPVFTFYLLSDYPSFYKRIEPYIPLRHRSRFQTLLNEIDGALGGFIRGQLLVCLIVGGLTSLGLYLVGVDLAFIIGMASGLANIVPYLGLVGGIFTSSLMAFLKFGDLMHPLMAIGVYVLVQTIDGFFITPRIVGKKVGLSPLIIISGLVVGGNLFGFVGILLAVPAMAVLKVLMNQLLNSYLRSSFYRGHK
jgi:predicted PurR-regulated permease PerM